jgi:hypothetical protein
MPGDRLKTTKQLQAIHVAGVDALRAIRQREARCRDEMGALADLKKTVFAAICHKSVPPPFLPNTSTGSESEFQRAQANERSRGPLVRKRRNGRSE